MSKVREYLAKLVTLVKPQGLLLVKRPSHIYASKYEVLHLLTGLKRLNLRRVLLTLE